jgi:hypothetical protein
MDSWIRIGVIVLLFSILASLGSALFYFARRQGDSSKMLRALTIRVGLSLALFILLMILWRAGLVSPHGLGAGGQQ